MTSEERNQAKASGDTPPEVLRDTGRRTSPPGNAERDEVALRMGEERLAQAAGSH